MKPAHGARDTSAERLREILSRQQAAFADDLPVDLSTRRERLERATRLLLDHQDAFAAAMDADFGGRPKALSKLTDIVAPVNALRHARKNLKKWLRRDRRRVQFPLNLLGARAWVEYQPKGVVGIVSPWNYPVALTFTPLAGALAAGNRVMIKPSERTPATSELIRETIARHFDDSEIAVVTGGVDTGKAFSALAFDHLLFTGGIEAGRAVLSAAAEQLTPVTLELGGKSPTIVSESADLGLAARRIVLGKMLNGGQTCLAPDYVLVPRERLAEFVAAVRAFALEAYPAAAGNADYASLIDARHAQRIAALIEQARIAGNEIVEVQRRGEDGRAPLVLLIEPDAGLDVMREEIFGPVLPIVTYDTIDRAIEYINAQPRPLALYYFGRDDTERRRVLDRTISGGVTLNDVLYHVTVDDLPLGGIGQSGMGAYHGIEGFRTFSHARAIYRQPRVNIERIAGLIPPYGKRLQRLIDFSLR